MTLMIRRKLEDRVSGLLGELRTEKQLLREEEMKEELMMLERSVGKRKKELRSIQEEVEELLDEREQLQEQVR